MGELTSYNEYLYQIYEYRRTGKTQSIKTIIDMLPKDLDMFYKNEKFCPHCNSQLEEVFTKAKRISNVGDVWADLVIYECPNCHWWRAKEKLTDELVVHKV